MLCFQKKCDTILEDKTVRKGIANENVTDDFLHPRMPLRGGGRADRDLFRILLPHSRRGGVCVLACDARGQAGGDAQAPQTEFHEFG